MSELENILKKICISSDLRGQLLADPDKFTEALSGNERESFNRILYDFKRLKAALEKMTPFPLGVSFEDYIISRR